MIIRTKHLMGTILPAVLILLLVGCATNSNTHPGEYTPQEEDTVLPATAEPIEEFDSVTAARENAVSQADQLELLEESTDSTIDDESLTSETDTILDQAADEPDNTEDQIQTDIETDVPSYSGTSAPANDDIWQRLRAGFPRGAPPLVSNTSDRMHGRGGDEHFAISEKIHPIPENPGPTAFKILK